MADILSTIGPTTENIKFKKNCNQTKFVRLNGLIIT